jgi:hypothetical protein
MVLPLAPSSFAMAMKSSQSCKIGNFTALAQTDPAGNPMKPLSIVINYELNAALIIISIIPHSSINLEVSRRSNVKNTYDAQQPFLETA